MKATVTLDLVFDGTEEHRRLTRFEVKCFGDMPDHFALSASQLAIENEIQERSRGK